MKLRSVAGTATGLEVTALGYRGWRMNSTLAASKTLASELERTCSRLSTVRFATGPKTSMGHVLGAEKGIFSIRGDDGAPVHGGRAGLILSIPVQKVSLGPPRVGTIHVHAPTPHTPPLQGFLADFSQQAAEE